jgi:hypothetical protein
MEIRQLPKVKMGSPANDLPLSRTLDEILAHWRATKFTGIAIFNVALGIPHSVEFGRPDRIRLDHEHLLEKSVLTGKEHGK